MNKISFDQLASLYRAISFDNEMDKGVLHLESNEQIAILKTALDDTEGNYGLSLSTGNSESLEIGKSVLLNVDNPRIGLGIFSRTLDDLLLIRKARIEEPKNYFLCEEKFNRTDDAIPNSVIQYRSTLSLIRLLKDSAAYLDENKAELVYIDNGKFEVPIEYNQTDIKNASLDKVEQLIKAIENDTHKEQKLSILGSAVIEISKSSPPKERFKSLLAHLPELVEKFSDGYRLFVSSFSYDKVKDELHAAKVEYTTKIHKVFSDIQNQILGIPIATVVVATQMKDAKVVGYEFWINTSVLVGCYVFVILMFFLIANQIHTLVAIEDDLRRQKGQMATKYSDIQGKFSDIFKALDKRLLLQKIILYFVSAILSIGFILSHVVYFTQTEPAKEWGCKVFLSCPAGESKILRKP